MMEENGTNGEVDYGPKDIQDPPLQQDLTPNGDVNHCPRETKGPSLQQTLATRKVIQLKIDNPFITNGNMEDDADDPFCIKPSVNNYKNNTQEGTTKDQDAETANEDPPSLDEVDNVSSAEVSSVVMESENLQNKTLSSNESSLDSIVSKEKFLPNDESPAVTSSEDKINDSDENIDPDKNIDMDKNSDGDKTDRKSESDETDIVSGDTEEKTPEDSLPTDETVNKSIEENNPSVDEKPESISVEEDKELSHLPTQLDVDSAKYFISSDSKDSSDVGTSLSRSDQVELNDSIISVSEENSSYIDSNVSEPVPEFVASSGEEDSEIKDKKETVKLMNEEKVESVEKISGESDGKKEEKETQMEDETMVKQPESSVKEDSSDKTDSVTNQGKENKTETSQNNNATSEGGSTVQEEGNEAVEKVKDVDGSDILITINEDSDKDEDVSKGQKKSSVKPEPVQQVPKVTSTIKDDVVIVDLSDEKPIPPIQNKVPVMPLKAGMITVGPNGQQYIQHVVHCLDGRKQIIQVPVTSASSIPLSKGPGPYTSLLNKAISSATHSQVVSKWPEDNIHPDDLIPHSSWELLALVKYEASQKKFDNTFWNGSCPVKSDISSMTKFLQDLGGDIVKQSAYSQIVEVQGRKSDQGKLGDKEKENLERMKKVVKELKEKYKHLELQTEKCPGCNFVTESKNVMTFHKEHPHMSPPLDPFGILRCPQDACDFETSASPEAFAEHMEKEHSVKARIYDKPDPFKCHLCYFEAKMKNNLTRHRFKCDKQFKLNQNLHPNYTDINYCLKNIMYKSQIEAKKARANPVPPVIKQPFKPPLIRPKIVISKPQTPIMLQQGPRNAQVPFVIPISQSQIGQLNLTRAVRPVTNPVLVSMGPNTVTKQPPQTVGAMLKQQQSVVNRPVVPKPSVPPTQQAGFEVCEICGGYVKDRMSLQIHFFYAHKVDLPGVLFQKNSPQFRCNVCQAPFWTAMGLAKHRQSSRHFDTVIVPKTEVRCWICFQQPENLYSHLQTVHHMTTNECMILRRCMFCAIQTRTRKDLELHMASAHGIVIKGAPTAVPSGSVQPTKPQGARNNFCVFCSKQFPDNTQLTLHCLRDHATCSGCGMVVSRAADLAKHICKSAGRKCPVCGLKNLKQAFYNKHIRTHVKKCSVKIKRLTEKEIEVAMGKERKAKMDLEKQREIFTKLESEIWDEIQSRRKRDDADSTTNSKKRKSNESDKSVSKKVRREDEEIVVVE